MTSKYGTAKYNYCYEYGYNDNEVAGGGDTGQPSYESFCEGGEGIYMDALPNKQYLENRFEAEVSLTIKGVDLFVGNTQMTYVSSEKSSYNLEVNGNDVGSPEFIYSDSYGYTLRWMD